MSVPSSPDQARFLELAREHGVVPITRRVLADLVTPLGVYDQVRGAGPSFLLESAEHGERWGRYSFVGFDPFLVVRSRGGSASRVRCQMGSRPRSVPRPGCWTPSRHSWGC